MDNCWRENKNWIMFSYLSWLVETGVFQKVQVGFMIVGCALDCDHDVNCLRDTGQADGTKHHLPHGRLEDDNTARSSSWNSVL